MTKLELMLEDRGLSISQFARIVGIPQSTVHRIVSGTVDLRSVRAEYFVRIARGLGLTAEELLLDDPRYEGDKTEIDIVYATTSCAGRHAMLANARGVRSSYGTSDEFFLPDIGIGLPDFKTL